VLADRQQIIRRVSPLLLPSEMLPRSIAFSQMQGSIASGRRTSGFSIETIRFSA